QGPPDSLRVVTMLDRGVEQAGLLSNEPAAQADMLLTLGRLYTKFGRYPRADSLLQKSLSILRDVSGNEHPDVAANLLALSQLREDQANLPEAERFAREALALLRRTRPTGHADVATAMTSLGRVLQARNELPQAVAILEDAVRLQTTSGATARELGVSVQ